MKIKTLGIGVALAAAAASLWVPEALSARAVGLPAAAQAPAALSAADLDRLLAPIALYPDQLLAQMFLCATKPAKVGALYEWMAANPSLKGSELQDAAVKSGFDQSFAALVVFPDVVGAMASDMDRTTRLGQAFAADRSAVFASVQRLRKKASDAGKLKSTPQQDVETKTTSSGENVIVIEPANPQVVYVPQYNPQTVYTPSTSTTVVVQEDDDDAGAAVAAGLIGFTAGVALGAAFDNDYYYGPYGWHGGGYMYNDGWDDWYDAREDARDDWQDHREDMLDERGDRREDIADERGDRSANAQQQRTERQQTTQQQRSERQQTRTEGQTQRTGQRAEGGASATGQTRQAPTASGASMESRGYSGSQRSAAERSGTSSGAFSGYSSGKSERAASSRGQKSRGSSARSGGRRR
jgi:hypothetical protein